MKMVTKVAFANAAYHRSKNILTGIAIFLTTVLLFLVPTMGLNLIQVQKAAIQKLYPGWHGMLRDVTGQEAKKLSAYHGIKTYGLAEEAGVLTDGDQTYPLMYLDEQAMEMYKFSLVDGHMPVKANELVVSEGLMHACSIDGKVGDTITLSCQISKDGGLDVAKEKTFVISGIFADQTGQAQKTASAVVSAAFLRQEIPANQIRYRFLFQVDTDVAKDTDSIEAQIQTVAAEFKIAEKNVDINNQYLGASYVDPSFVPVVSVILLVIAVAGMITIYTIYYISMNEQVRELGKIKAIGATTGQLRQIVLAEGLRVSCIAIPLGLFAGSVLAKLLLRVIFQIWRVNNEWIDTIQELLSAGKLIPWVYLLAGGIAVLTVILSLLHPMRIAANVSEVDAMRYHDDGSRKKTRKGYHNLTVGKLANVYLFANRKKSILTICSMAATGVFFMVVATVLSCANPKEAADSDILGSYEISPVVEFNNREHPEREWKEIQKNNPLTEELKEQILQIDGIHSVDCYYGTYAVSDAIDGEKEGILGIPESGKEMLEKGIIKGHVSYEDLKSGDKIVVEKNLLYWYPDLQPGDVIDVAIETETGTIHKNLEIAAIGEYSGGFTDYNYFLMASDGLKTFAGDSCKKYFHIYADKKYDEQVEAQLKSLVADAGNLSLATWQEYYEQWRSDIALSRTACFAFLGILGAICILNMVNTMINSVYVRKKELGMLQAIGMSDAQLLKMLQYEGLFYTMGTLLVAVGGGSAISYPVFLWAKGKGMLDISAFHYPVQAAVFMVLVLVLVQLLLGFAVGRSVKKDSLIDRIRFEN